MSNRAMNNIDGLKREATRLFLGKAGVVGVGSASQNVRKLIFFLEYPVPQLESEIRAWARTRKVTVDFIISGEFIETKQHVGG